MVKTPTFLKNRYKNDIKNSDMITIRYLKNGTKIKDIIDSDSKFTVILWTMESVKVTLTK